MNGSRLAFSLSIDGTKVAKAAQISQGYGAILGGTYPDRFINTTCVSDEDFSITLESSKMSRTINSVMQIKLKLLPYIFK